MLFSSFSTRSMVFAYFTKAQLPFFLFRDLFNDTAEFALCYGLHDCSHLFQGYFIHSLSTLYYYNAPSLTTRLTGDYRDRTYTGKCSPALLDTRKKKLPHLCNSIFNLLFLPVNFFQIINGYLHIQCMNPRSPNPPFKLNPNIHIIPYLLENNKRRTAYCDTPFE